MMKRNIILIFAMLIAFTACGSEQQAAPGTEGSTSADTIISESETITSHTDMVTDEITSVKTDVSETETEVSETTVTTADTEEITETEATEPEIILLSAEELENIAEKNIKGYINCFECDDFDGDGLKEAFVIAADTANGDDEWWDDGICERVYFLNNSGEVSLIKDHLLGGYFNTDVEKTVRFGDKKFFTFSSTAGASGVEGYIFGVDGESFTEPDISASEEKCYCGFYNGKDGRVYAEDNSFILSGGGRQFFEHLVEYDESSNTFTVKENTGLINARKYAQLAADNENVWKNDFKKDEGYGASGLRYCGFADLDGDGVPEFLAMCGRFGAHGAEGYRVYRFEDGKMIPFTVDDPERYDDDDPIHIFTWREYENDPMNYVYEYMYADADYPSAFYFIRDKKGGNIRYITADRDGVASESYYFITEYSFENGVIKSNVIETCVISFGEDGSESLSFYEGLYNGTSDDKQISKERFIEIYDSLFDTGKNDICTDRLWMFAGQIENEYSDKIQFDSSYDTMSYEEKIHTFMSDYIVGLETNNDTWLHEYNSSYSAIVYQDGIVLPFEGLIKELRK